MGFIVYKKLLNRCIDVLDCYQQFDLSAENINNVEEILESVNSMEREDQIFISEIFLGCCEFSKLLDVVIDNFYARDKNASISDKTLFKIIAYLVTFRLKEIGKNGISEIILQMNQADRIIQFLKYYLDEKLISSCLKLHWYNLCDDDLVDDIILTLNRSIDGVNEACDYAINVLKLTRKAKKTARKDSMSCDDKMFSLKLSMTIKDTMWDALLVKPDKEESMKLNHWKILFNQCVEGIDLPLHNIDNNKNNNFINCNNNKNNHNNQLKIASKNKSKVNVIRLNMAAILREGSLYKKKEEEMLKKIDQWESGGGDPIKYDEWKKKMKEEADEKKYEEVELARLMGKLAQERSIIAKQKNIEENKRKVEAMRAQAAQIMQQYLIMKLDEEDKMRQKHDKVNSMKKDSREARRKMIDMKVKVVQDMQEGMKELMRAALKEAEEEMRQRLKVIRQIKDIEVNRVIRSKVFDLNETSGCGLHTEMSISELRERLKQMQEEEVKRLEAKKKEILQNKLMKEQMLQVTLNNIAKHRGDIATAACERSDAKKRLISIGRHKTSAILELEKKFEELKSERILLEKNRNSCTLIEVCTNVTDNKQTKKSRVELLFL